MQQPLGILIAGTSHVGKSTFAKAIARSLDRELISTDELARHPGRPWPSAQPQVAEYYSKLSDDTIHWFLKAHHENLWPRIEQIIEVRRQLSKPFILEGSALRPEYMARIEPGLVYSVILYGDNEFLRIRLIEESRLGHADQASAAAIKKFIERSIRENSELVEAARRLNIRCVDIAVPGAFDTLMQEFLIASANTTVV
jgi:2-phosphoglycerate kinase